jgi:DNA-binding GntR family transcriptional regulator
MKKTRQTIETQKTLRAQIVDSLKESIATGRLKPGEKISETKLAEDLGISRTPLREAIQTLEAEGFLKVIPRKGAVVSDFSRKDIEDIYDIKAILEGLAARLATENLTASNIQKLENINGQLRSLTLKGESSAGRFFKLHNEFHDTFLQAGNNDRLYQLNCHLMGPFKRFRLSSLAIPGRFEESVKAHDEIIEAFKAKDAKKAEELVIKNVLEGKKALISRVESK